jgi:hypothetical protein
MTLQHNLKGLYISSLSQVIFKISVISGLLVKRQASWAVPRGTHTFQNVHSRLSAERLAFLGSVLQQFFLDVGQSFL